MASLSSSSVNTSNNNNRLSMMGVEEQLLALTAAVNKAADHPDRRISDMSGLGASFGTLRSSTNTSYGRDALGDDEDSSLWMHDSSKYQDFSEVDSVATSKTETGLKLNAARDSANSDLEKELAKIKAQQQQAEETAKSKQNQASAAPGKRKPRKRESLMMTFRTRQNSTTKLQTGQMQWGPGAYGLDF